MIRLPARLRATIDRIRGRRDPQPLAFDADFGLRTRRLALFGGAALGAASLAGHAYAVPCTNQSALITWLPITYTQISTNTVTVSAFRTLGYSTLGDGGDAIYVKGTSSGPMAVQDASGQWWVLAQVGEWTPQAWGAAGNGSTDDTTAVNAWLAALVTYGMSGYAKGVFSHTGLTLNTYGAGGNAVAIRGSHPSQTIFKTRGGTTNPILTVIGTSGYGGQPQCVMSNLTLDGNNYNSGHGIYCYSSGGYGQAFLGINVTILKPGTDGLYVGTNCGAGRLLFCTIAHPGRNAINFNSGDWQITNCQISGAEFAGLPVTNVINSPTTPGLCRVTVTGHGMTTGQSCYITSVQGATEAIGSWTPTIIDANTLDLPGSVYGAAYSALGRCIPIWTVAGAANNGSGLIRITTTQNHNLATGAQAFFQNVGGVPDANGGWVVTVIDSTHLDLQGSTFYGAYTSGGTGHSAVANVWVSATASNQLLNCDMYNGLFGVLLTSSSGDAFQMIGGSIDTHWREGIFINTMGLAGPHSFTGPIRMSNNSYISSGMFPDILLSNTAATTIETSHVLGGGGNLVNYCLATDGTCVGPVDFRPNMDQSGAHNPYSVGIQTQTGDCNSRYGAWSTAVGAKNAANGYSFVSGYSNSAGGQQMIIGGGNNSGTGNYGALLGHYAADKGESSIVWGGNQFLSTGDNQVRVVVTAGAVTTNATPTRLLVLNATTPSGTNTFNLFFNYQSAAYDRITIMCKNPATGDTKTWVVDNLVAKRGSSISAITLNGSSSTINPSAVYSSDSALSACSVSLAPDTTYGGIAITGTGLASTTLHWSVKASPLEVV